MKPCQKPATSLNQDNIIPFPIPEQTYDDYDVWLIKDDMWKKRWDRMENDPTKLRNILKRKKKSIKNINELIGIHTEREIETGKKSSSKETLFSLLDMDKQEIKEALSKLEKEEHIWKTTPTLRGVKEISKAAGIKPREVKSFVETKELPAFKIY
nr:hypothetical protein [uncultured Desulfobacter sp.]